MPYDELSRLQTGGSSVSVAVGAKPGLRLNPGINIIFAEGGACYA